MTCAPAPNTTSRWRGPSGGVPKRVGPRERVPDGSLPARFETRRSAAAAAVRQRVERLPSPREPAPSPEEPMRSFPVYAIAVGLTAGFVAPALLPAARVVGGGYRHADDPRRDLPALRAGRGGHGGRVLLRSGRPGRHLHRLDGRRGPHLLGRRRGAAHRSSARRRARVGQGNGRARHAAPERRGGRGPAHGRGVLRGAAAPHWSVPGQVPHRHLDGRRAHRDPVRRARLAHHRTANARGQRARHDAVPGLVARLEAQAQARRAAATEEGR